MSASGSVALAAIALVGVASAVIGSLGVRVARSTSDFLVASRTVGPVAAASAISGEYLCAAAFLGVAGLILREGADALWFPAGIAAGYLALVLFVAAPLRRSGAYNVPDFAVARLRSDRLRRVCTVFALIVGWFYLLTQLQGAGLTLTALTGFPPWSGIAGAGLVVVLTVAGGGMRSITFVQAFQFWLKLTALVVPAMFLVTLFLSDSRTLERDNPPSTATDTRVDVRADVVLQVPEPITLSADGTVDGASVDGPLSWSPGRHEVTSGTELRFPAGAPLPTVIGSPTTDGEWLEPGSGDAGHQTLEVYSLLIATVLGTMGLPHVLVRFYTSPDGRAARRTAAPVLVLVGAFFLSAVLVGALSRLYTPELLSTGQSDAAVLLMPVAALGQSWTAWVLGGLVAAGTAAAFLSASSGLLLSSAGVLATDVLRGRWKDFRLATVLSALPPIALALTVPRLDFALTVPLVFAVAASTFCPLLVLGIWWRGLTATGAIAGVMVGGVLSTLAVLFGLFVQLPLNLVGLLVYRPAIVTVPAAFLTMVIVSWATRSEVCDEVDDVLLRLHAPERLGLDHGSS